MRCILHQPKIATAELRENVEGEDGRSRSIADAEVRRRRRRRGREGWSIQQFSSTVETGETEVCRRVRLDAGMKPTEGRKLRGQAIIQLLTVCYGDNIYIYNITAKRATTRQ